MMQGLHEFIKNIQSDNVCGEIEELESPIEERFYNHIQKFLKSEVNLVPQFKINTISGNFRLDFALIGQNRMIGIECDGEEFHTEEVDDWYDEWRDVLILHQSKVNAIYRIRGKEIYNHILESIYFIANYEPSLFKTEYIKRLKNSIVDSLKLDDGFNLSQNKIGYLYSKENSSGKQIQKIMEFKFRDLNRHQDSLWDKYMKYSILHQGVPIKELIKLFEQKLYTNEELDFKIQNLIRKKE